MGINKLKTMKDFWPHDIRNEWINAAFGEVGQGAVDTVLECCEFDPTCDKVGIPQDVQYKLSVAIGKIIEAAYMQGKSDKAEELVQAVAEQIRRKL